MRRIFGPRRDEVTGEWRRLHNKELNDLYSSPNIVRVIKSRRMRWAGHVARMGEKRGGVEGLNRKVCHPRCVYNNYIWVCILSDTTTGGIEYVYYIGVSTTCFGLFLWSSSGRYKLL